MEFLKKALFGKKDSDRKTSPLREVVPNFEIRIRAQLNLLEETIDSFDVSMNTSLDVLLRKGIDNLRASVLEYARLLEQVLIIREVVPVSALRQRRVSEIVRLATENLKFYGGEKVSAAAQFLNKITNTYLAQVDERDFIDHVKAVRSDFNALRLFIMKN